MNEDNPKKCHLCQQPMTYIGPYASFDQWKCSIHGSIITGTLPQGGSSDANPT